MATDDTCKFYLAGGKCSHKDAPDPRHSWCVAFVCSVSDDPISEKIYQVITPRNRQSPTETGNPPLINRR